MFDRGLMRLFLRTHRLAMIMNLTVVGGDIGFGVAMFIEQGFTAGMLFMLLAIIGLMIPIVFYLIYAGEYYLRLYHGYKELYLYEFMRRRSMGRDQ